MPRIVDVKAFVLRDTADQTVLNDESRVDRASDVFNNRVAFTCLLMHPDGYLYCGVTAYNTDIFHRFDPKAEAFESLNYRAVSEPFEVKIHRSLELAGDGSIYGATACLHTLDKRRLAPGGALFRYDVATRRIEKLAIPAPRDYIQTISLDWQRKLIYGQTYPVFRLFAYDLKTGTTQDLDFIGSITHLSALDDAGCLWGTWGVRGHDLLKVAPGGTDLTFFPHGLPEGKKYADMMYPGAGPVDCMINGRDGFLYIGTTGGTLCRLDPRTGEVTYLGRPAPTTRMPGLVLLDEHRLLCAGGDQEGGYLAIYDRRSGAWQNLGALVETGTGRKLYRVHDLVVADGGRTAYIAETDVPKRSGYLWRARLDV